MSVRCAIGLIHSPLSAPINPVRGNDDDVLPGDGGAMDMSCRNAQVGRTSPSLQLVFVSLDIVAML